MAAVVPVAVVVKAAGLFEDAGELHAARAQVERNGGGFSFGVSYKWASSLLKPDDARNESRNA